MLNEKVQNISPYLFTYKVYGSITFVIITSGILLFRRINSAATVSLIKNKFAVYSVYSVNQ